MDRTWILLILALLLFGSIGKIKEYWNVLETPTVTIPQNPVTPTYDGRVAYIPTVTIPACPFVEDWACERWENE